MSPENNEFIIPNEYFGQRLDQVLAQLMPDYSRSKIQDWLKKGLILLNRQTATAKSKVQGGEIVSFAQAQALAEIAEPQWTAQAIDLNIVYEDAFLLVINKPVGLVVHPGAGNQNGTLANALVHHAPELANVPRNGIVHRIDKETSGLLVVARSLSAHNDLVNQLENREFEREYLAVCQGVMTAGGKVDAPIGRHPQQRVRMAVVRNGKPAVTHYRVLEKFRAHTFLRLKLETGRTHQIRVHMAHIHYPLVGDPVYGGRLKMPAGISEDLRQCLSQFRRQALHAASLGLHHPDSGEFVHWQIDLPDDMQHLLAELRADKPSD